MELVLMFNLHSRLSMSSISNFPFFTKLYRIIDHTKKLAGFNSLAGTLGAIWK